MAGFTKLCSEIVTSSIWSESHATRIVWVTMLAIADSSGRVDASIPGLARTANVTLAECEQAITTFCTPDQYSRSREYDGRRIAAVDGGWLILNYGKYRARRDPEERLKQNREAKQRQREREKGCQPMSANVSQCQPDSAYGRGQRAEAEIIVQDSCPNTEVVPDARAVKKPPAHPLERANFEKARSIYPGKKRGLDAEFTNFQSHHKDWKELLDDDGLAQCVQTLIGRKAYSPGFWPMFQTFCNQSRYEEALQPQEGRK